MTTLRVITFTLVLLQTMWQPASAWAVEPVFHTRSYNAFTRIYGRPEFFAGSMREQGSIEARLTLDLVSFSERESTATEQIELDGETYQAALSYDYTVSERWSVGLWVPYLYNSGGFMDANVDGFHDLFGFPEGDRPTQGQDELFFALNQNGQNQFLLDSSGGDLGDIQLNTRLLLTRPDPKARQLSLYGGVKLPTGDQSKLTGSGAADYSLGLGYSDPLLLQRFRMTVSANAGILWLGNGDVLEEQQKQTVGFGGLQLALAATRRLTLLAQIQAASAYYDSSLDILGGTTVQLSFGADVSWPESGWNWRIGIIEDGLSEVTPDFTLQTELSLVFPRR
jgi:hypothetical protein